MADDPTRFPPHDKDPKEPLRDEPGALRRSGGPSSPTSSSSYSGPGYSTTGTSTAPTTPPLEGYDPHHDESRRSRAYAEDRDDDGHGSYERSFGREKRPSGKRGSTVGLVSGLAQDVALLVRKEAALARAEMSEKLDQARSGVSALGAGAFVSYAGFLVLLFALVAGIDEWIDQPWLSALIVGGLVLVVGLVLLGLGRNNLKARNLTFERTARSLRKDADLAREETRRMN